jgi:hypothetical protein
MLRVNRGVDVVHLFISALEWSSGLMLGMFCKLGSVRKGVQRLLLCIGSNVCKRLLLCMGSGVCVQRLLLCMGVEYVQRLFVHGVECCKVICTWRLEIFCAWQLKELSVHGALRGICACGFKRYLLKCFEIHLCAWRLENKSVHGPSRVCLCKAP